MARTPLNQYSRDAIVRMVMADVPKKSHDEIVNEIQTALYVAMKPEVREFAKRYPKAMCVDDGIPSCWTLGMDHHHNFVVANLTEEEVERVTDPYVKAFSAQRDIERKLEQQLKGCRTVEQALKLMPELEPYVKSMLNPGPTANLPAVANLFADLAKLGWPKDTK